MCWQELDHENEIQSEFNDLQSLYLSENIQSCEPKLHEEVDPQDWQDHRLLTKPQGEINVGNEPTCLNVKVSSRKWKNQYAEGYYTHVSVQQNTQWAENDYREMSLTPCPNVKEYQPPTLDEITLSSAPLEEMTGEDLDNVIRVQISMKQKGTDVKGRYRNIELHQVDLNKVFSSCENLLNRFPKQKSHKHIVYYTRVQLQNKVNGKMKGGRNLSLHNATPEEIHTILYSRFKTRGWI